ncbi:MAG TPA: GreA/GreB family elongation factor [Myxococcota bacterium]|nr:GreA/GreB family elongation factor [Myxococcota bacterium]
MSKAFTDEEAGEDAPIVPQRAPLPPGVPNYVTARGLARLRDELAALHAERGRAGALADEKQRGRALGALTQRRVALEQRIATAELVPPPSESLERVRFGATVTVAGADGERRYEIVGVDEADPAQGMLAFTSPLARALVGRAAGDTIRLRTPRGEEEVVITRVAYGE